jgi:hypothetical protein
MKSYACIAGILSLLLISCGSKNEKLPILGRKEIKNVSFEGKIKADTI